MPEALKHLSLSYPSPNVLEVKLSRPEKRNAFNERHWKELGYVFSELVPAETAIRCVILTGDGPTFSAGIDLSNATVLAGPMGANNSPDPFIANAAGVLRSGRQWQQAWRSINLCGKPVIAAIHGGCFGAALEMICFCDGRFTTL